MKDFDSTRQYYNQYAAKWANTLNSAIKWYPQPPSIVSSMVSKNFHPQFTSIQVSSPLAEYGTCERSTQYTAQGMETLQL